MTTINALVAKHAAECAELIIEARCNPDDKRAVFLFVENALYRFHADAVNLEHMLQDDLMRKVQTRMLKR